MSDSAFDLDIDPIVQTFRSVADVDAFDRMLAAWDARLSAGAISDKGRLVPHLHDAIALLQAQDTIQVEDPLEVEVNQVARAAMALSPELGVALSNAAAKRLFGATQGRTLGLDWIADESRPDLQSLQRSARGSGNRKHALIRVFDSEGTTTLAEAFVLSVSKTQQSFLIVRSVDSAWSDSVDSVLADAFGFTRAELQIAKMLVEGGSPALIAARRGTGVQTVRTQIKAMVAKAGAQSLIDLVRLLSLTCARLTERDTSKGVRWADPWGNLCQIERSDGFKVAYSWTGAPDGQPVFLLHGLSLGYLLGDRVERRLRDAGIKLIAPCWPGMGGSEQNPDLSLKQDDLAAYRAVVDALGLKNCLGVGLATGTIHLLALERARPGTFGALLGISDCFPLTSDRLSLAPLSFRTMLRLPITLPKALELVVNAGFRNVRRKGIDWYVERRYHQSPVDRASCDDVEFVPLMRNWCELSFTMGPTVFCNRAAQRWSFREEHLRDLSVPLHVMLGESEPMFDAPFFERLEQACSNLTIERVAAAGELLLHQRPKLIAQRIIEMAAAVRR
ncbi:alpha/beta fold hydrolase [Parasphingorhabdus cellanae]|uniref:Alpha/beta hydrolase n=1 Tax=Parasphingorhabdus cellanae TaxID=2806553 RepID=A0ABX7T116_9SPHN|nr:alpha/beta fold hydrolase [Parasphingorhabdus cellanae]QTD54470.1 alpha/beta hydrolase [Parasphingorhabdus cellanae]